MAAKRVRQLRKGAEPAIVSKNKDIVVSLREIAAGKVKKTAKKQETSLLEPQPLLLEALLEETNGSASVEEEASINEETKKIVGESSSQDS
jgi:DNA-directed RNA polymerase subunit omega